MVSNVAVGDAVFLEARFNNYLGVVVNVAIDKKRIRSYEVEWNDGTGSTETHTNICEFRQKYLDLLAK